jgi:RHS repeat-associated protein
MNRITAADPPPRGFSFDLDGNLTGGYTSEGFPFTAVYDQENRLINLSYTDGTGAAIEIRYTYRFDHFLAKIERFTDGVATGATHIIRNGGLAIQDRDGSNTVVREYLWGAGMGGGIGGLLQLRQNGAVYTYNYDGNGNVIGLLDEAGELVQQYRYDVYGMIEAQSGAIDQPFTFSTKRLDPATGLVYYGYRYYLPNLARWLTRDPIGEEGGVNLYGFVQNNPINLFDPWGLSRRMVPFVGYVDSAHFGYPQHLPPPPSRSPNSGICLSLRTQCLIACNAAFLVPCTAIGIGGGIAGTPVTGVIVGLGCRGVTGGTCYLTCMGADSSPNCECN